MVKRYFLSKQGQQVGPYSVNEILEKLEATEHAWNDYIYEDSKEDWVLLLDHPLLTSKYEEGWARKPMVQISEHPYHEKKWLVLKEEKKFGPFSYLEVVQMLQEKTLMDQDCLSTTLLPGWRKVKEYEEFANSKVQQLLVEGDRHVQEVFNRRRYPRAQFEGTLIVHDNKTIFRGQSFQISAGGVGLLIPSQALLPGQTLLLHFHPSIDVPAFNAVVSVVSKCNPSNDQEMTPHRYGVKFTSISQNIKEQIYSYTSRKMEAA